MGRGEAGVGTTVNFCINGKDYSVNPLDGKIRANTMLVDFIRKEAHLTGTKIMCREGGCGACVVTVKIKDPVTGADVTKSVNSCLTPVLSCNGWSVSTVESLGNKEEGYDKIQQRLVNFHGTQCGFCTPGMVMNMNSLMESKNGKITVEDVEKSFDGNICRCTGYRPILDAFKSLAVDAPEYIQKKCADIEDIANCACSAAKNGCCKLRQNTNFSITLSSGEEWITANNLSFVNQTISRLRSSGTKFRFVAGNTASGVYKHDGPYKAYIDIANVPELKKCTLDGTSMVLGGSATLAETIDFLKNKAASTEGFEYAKDMGAHIERVANVPVRNNGTIAGNLMIKHMHEEFPSDIFLLLETIGAKLSISTEGGAAKQYSMTEFLALDMKGKLIISAHLPQKKGYIFRSFKITRRYQNAHAYVNAGFLFKIDTKDNYKVLEKPRIVYGGINPKFVHAAATEMFLLENKHIGDSKVLQGAMNALEQELKPNVAPLEAAPEYRKKVAKSLLYKTIMGIVKDKVNKTLKSGATDIERHISKGMQSYEVDTSSKSLYKAVPKIEAYTQASGEAEYVDDIPMRPGELYAAFVLSDVAVADIKKIDPSEALKMEGVVRFVSAEDIPGNNNFMKYFLFPVQVEEQVFASHKVMYHGQSLGLIVAETQDIANEAAKKVKVTYENVKKPVVDIVEAFKKAEATGAIQKQHLGNFKSVDGEGKVPIKHTIKGEFRVGSQYHFHMETQRCVCVPREDGMDVFSATQYMDQVQTHIAEALGVPSSSINVQVRRIGGGFGGKITKPPLLGVACAVAAQAVRKPVRLVLDMETNMRLIGKRYPYYVMYEAGFDDNGKLGRLKAKLYCDCGWSPNDQSTIIAMVHMQNVYDAVGWDIWPGVLMTDTAANTACRAPGSIQGIALLEFVMEHIAHTLKKDPFEVRQANLINKGDHLFFTGFVPDPNLKVPMDVDNLIPRMYEEMKVAADLEARKRAVAVFNKENRWKKRGLSVVPVRYPIDYFPGAKYPTQVVIYHNDGTVAVSTGGIEMGQGLNTKIVQTVSEILGVPMDKIRTKPADNFVGNNAICTGGSIGSEVCAYGSMRCCETLKERLKPFLEEAKGSWEAAVAAAHRVGVDLCATHAASAADGIQSYHIWVLTASEVEIDVLTGEYKVVRVDILEDTGKCLSPGIDIGQIEGGFIFGQGLWTTEKIIHDQNTGEILTTGTWDYKVPETRDIPEDIRITLLKNAPNPRGILSSKATGEPIMCASVCVLLAMKQAIAAARSDVGNNDWFQLDGPVTPEDIVRHCLTDSRQFTF